jgi:cellulose synthase/poly-beta-1,6-N-acetylglucosamine synthase-like glycosyltransferase
MNPEITVAICTWNRAGELTEAVKSVADQMTSTPFEILVVDNGSTDSTPRVVARLSEELPNLRCVVEPVQGISRARNRALHAARAPVVLYLDSDARAEPGWLQAYVDALAKHPDAACIGGPVRLRWGRTPPSWLPWVARVYYGAYNLGAETHLLANGEPLRNMNMVLRRDAALAVGGYDASLGRRGRSLRTGEEDELLDRLRNAGHRVYWIGNAWINHSVPPDRVSIRWLLRRAWMQGVAEVAIAGSATTTSAGQLLARAAIEGRRAAMYGVLAVAGRQIRRRRRPDHLIDATTAAARAAMAVWLVATRPPRSARRPGHGPSRAGPAHAAKPSAEARRQVSRHGDHSP